MKSSDNKDKIQIVLFAYLSRIIPSSISIVEVLSELLGIGIDSAYRRIRGETPLNIDEVAKICSHFKISFDTIINLASGTVCFEYNPLHSSQSCREYLVSVITELKKALHLKQKQIIYAADDLPIFYNFGFPHLATFKLYYWFRSILNIPELDGQKYNPDFVSSEIKELAYQVYNLYAAIPTIEIWTEDTPISLLKQIGFYWDSGILTNKEEALLICNDVKCQIEKIEKQAEFCCKIDMKGNKITPDNSYFLYSSDIELGNNSILIKTDIHKLVYLSFNTFNKLTTGNTAFCEETEKWLNNLIKKSTLISGVSEKHRFKFFCGMYEKLNRLVKVIEATSEK